MTLISFLGKYYSYYFVLVKKGLFRVLSHITQTFHLILISTV